MGDSSYGLFALVFEFGKILMHIIVEFIGWFCYGNKVRKVLFKYLYKILIMLTRLELQNSNVAFI